MLSTSASSETSESPRQVTSAFDILAEELGAVAGRIEREAHQKLNLAIAEARTQHTALELRFVKLEERLGEILWLVKERIETLQDGKDGADGNDGKDGEPGIDGLDGKEGPVGPAGRDGADGVDGRPGLDGKDGAIGPRGPIGLQGLRGIEGKAAINGKDGEPGLRGEKGDVGPAGLDGLRGKDGAPGSRGEMGLQGLRGLKGDTGRDGRDGTNGERGERGIDGAPGKLVKASAWKKEINYEGAVVIHKGSLYQAACDTALEPDILSKDWVCLAMRGGDGKDGADGRSLTIKGTYDTSLSYDALDVVTLDHTWHVAKKDKPGVCPGPDWKSGPGIGRTGKPGERGERGLPGKEGPAGRDILHWDIDRKTYTITPIMGDGERGPSLSVRDLFEQFQMETR